MWSTTYMPNFQELEPTKDVWFKHSEEYGDVPEYEAISYFFNDGYVIGWYHNDVGLTTFVGEFKTYDDVVAWFEEQGYEDYTNEPLNERVYSELTRR